MIGNKWLRFNHFLAHRGLISSPLSRKIIHIGRGPIFVLCWSFFVGASISRWLAARVPLAITMQFALSGLGVLNDPQSVEAMARGGDRREILKGPLFYGIVFVLVTLVFWKDSPVGIVALMLLCGGDGLVDIVGKAVRRAAQLWSRRKTFAGLLGGLGFCRGSGGGLFGGRSLPAAGEWLPGGDQRNCVGGHAGRTAALRRYRQPDPAGSRRAGGQAFLWMSAQR